MLLLLANGLALLPTGCADERWNESHAQHSRSIQQSLSALENREERNAANLEALDARIRDCEADHAQYLQASVRLLSEAVRKEFARWPDRWEKAQAQVAKELAGRPDRARETAGSAY